MKRLIKLIRRIFRCRSRVPILPITVDNQIPVSINVQPAQAEDASQALSLEDVGTEVSEADPPVIEKFIRNFLKVMRYIGMSNYNPSGESKIPKRCVHYYKDILLKSAFWTAVVFAFMSAFLDAKYYWLDFLEQGGLMKFVRFGYHVITILVQVCLLRLFAFLHGRITGMLEKMDELLTFGVDQELREQEKRENRMLAVLIITTIAKCFLEAGIDKAIMDWSFEGIIEKRSKFFYQDINNWKMGDFKNDNVTYRLDTDLHEMNATARLSMGLLQVLLDFCSNMKLETAVDLVIVVGSCLLKYTRYLKRRVENDNYDNDGNDSAMLESPSGNWAYYEKLAEVSEAYNLVLDDLLKIMHTYAAMKFAYFLMQILENQATVLQFLYLLYSCAKVSLAYVIAKQSNGHNSGFQLWMTNWGLRSKEPTFPQKAILALKKMKLQIIGLGRGAFIIGESFMLQFGGMVGSIFMLQVDKADGQ